jgi:hypothetical protein
MQPFRATRHISCPYCGQLGMWVELKDKDGKTVHRSQDGNFRIEGTEDNPIFICGNCECKIPKRNSN